MSKDKQIIMINNKHLEKATMFVNKHNEAMQEAISQEEVTLFILDSWKGEDKSTLCYKGLMIFPEVVIDTNGKYITFARITMHSDFSFNDEDFQSYEV